MTRSPRPTGHFCWINVITPRSAEAREFFGQLLGWTYAEVPGLGHRIQVDGSDIGALLDVQGPATPPGGKPFIGVMVKVLSASDACVRVTALGGKARPPIDILDQGRLSVCTDPHGADFDVWEPKAMQGTDVDPRQPGAPSWFETFTPDVDHSTRFYCSLFGWTAEESKRTSPRSRNFRLGEQYVAGTLELVPALGNMRPHWATYFTVRDAHHAAREAARLGGQVCAIVQELPGLGLYCGITSPQGVGFHLIQYAT
jgi:uncharacterized protein